MARTIQSPGVEIKEIDLSLRPALATGTTVLATGFTDRGPTDEVIQVTSLSEFEQIYGTPPHRLRDISIIQLDHYSTHQRMC
jgi:hypothetical protein